MLRLTLAVVMLLSFGSRSFAQDARPAGGRVIVRLKDATRFADFRPFFSPDERLSDTRATGYLDRNVLGTIQYLERRYGFRSIHWFTRVLRGFAAELTPEQVAQLAANPLVESIEGERPVSLGSPGTAFIPAAQVLPWGIDRVDADISSTRAGDGSGTVTGVNIYIIDTGISVSHPELNVVEHVTFAGQPNEDCNGHGTFVSGVAAARDNAEYVVGMAPGAPLHGVKVLNCSGIGFPSSIVQGIDWVTANAIKPAVVNMSLGSAIPLKAVNDAVVNSAASGIFFAIAAGNGNPFTGQAMDACLTSPAGTGLLNFGIVTVAATDAQDAEPGFSNYGACVDIWAPGTDILSLWLPSQGGMFTGSGTSAASPHVAGAAALFLSRYPTSPVWFVEAVLKSLADPTGTFSKDGRPIRRLAVRAF